jgi:hypothetical protein
VSLYALWLKKKEKPIKWATWSVCVCVTVRLCSYDPCLSVSPPLCPSVSLCSCISVAFCLCLSIALSRSLARPLCFSWFCVWLWVNLF